MVRNCWQISETGMEVPNGTLYAPSTPPWFDGQVQGVSHSACLSALDGSGELTRCGAAHTGAGS